MKKSFGKEVEKQLVFLHTDPWMGWAMRVGIPLLSGLMCVPFGVWMISIGWNITGVLSLACGCRFLYKAYTSRYVWNVRLPNKEKRL